jgi:hypothetical protein
LLGLAGCSFAVKQALAQWLLLAILRILLRSSHVAHAGKGRRVTLISHDFIHITQTTGQTP